MAASAKKSEKIFEKLLTSDESCDIICKSPRISQGLRKHSSAGRALALQARGHRFEPYCFHHYGPIVQLVRTLACHARGRRFEPDSGRHFTCGFSSSGRAPPCQGGGSEFEPRNPLQQFVVGIPAAFLFIQGVTLQLFRRICLHIFRHYRGS